MKTHLQQSLKTEFIISHIWLEAQAKSFERDKNMNSVVYLVGMTKNSSRSKIGSRLASLRKEAGMSQAQLANAVDLPQRTIANYETIANYIPSNVLLRSPKRWELQSKNFSDSPLKNPDDAARSPNSKSRLSLFDGYPKKTSNLPRNFRIGYSQQLIDFSKLWKLSFQALEKFRSEFPNIGRVFSRPWKNSCRSDHPTSKAWKTLFPRPRAG